MKRTAKAAAPRLRPLDVRRHLQDGQVYFALHDPLRLSSSTLLVPQNLAAVLAFCDGTRDIAGMAAAFLRQYGATIDMHMVEDLIGALDDNYLLENERSDTAMSRCLAAYRAASHRPMSIAGQGYPDDPAELRALLNTHLEAAASVAKPAKAWPQRVGLLSPHIDYARGGEVYAEIWKHAGEAAKAAELVILFGTDHYGDDPITLTRQHYATPYGVLPTQQPVVDAIAAAIGEDHAFAGELRHRDEHSLELVAVWLHHMRDGAPVDVVPILTGSLQRFFYNGASPEDDGPLSHTLAAIDELAGDRRTLVIASGDLAHVGPAFGGSALDDADRSLIHKADDDLLQAMQDGNVEAFYGHIKRNDNANNVCGVAPIYLTMRLLAQGRNQSISGQRFGYATCPADAFDTSVVTVAGMAFS